MGYYSRSKKGRGYGHKGMEHRDIIILISYILKQKAKSKKQKAKSKKQKAKSKKQKAKSKKQKAKSKKQKAKSKKQKAKSKKQKAKSKKQKAKSKKQKAFSSVIITCINATRPPVFYGIVRNLFKPRREVGLILHFNDMD
ncbi:hypothetical protein [Yokenella regensburgei]|uniref:hypothetical protein n=1 Tax=Yokenella regensburgei TaxID=158877 RepID=UPI001432BE91|nr:hypothetical protein [Yokenella regensburgei]QIU88447.1 hypothetical protein HEC60_03285 [Yokenella regensburgei]